MPPPLIRLLDQSLCDAVSAQAAAHPRRRMNHNFHRHEEPVQRMLNAIEPGSYVRPHRHVDPPKWELFVCVRGRGACFVFDDGGSVIDMSPLDSTTHYGAEIVPGVWHCVVSLEPGTIFFEVKEGPFEPKHAGVFAPWAPTPDDPAASAFVLSLEARAR